VSCHCGQLMDRKFAHRRRPRGQGVGNFSPTCFAPINHSKDATVPTSHQYRAANSEEFITAIHYLLG
jgi:hypothetical protein